MNSLLDLSNKVVNFNMNKIIDTYNIASDNLFLLSIPIALAGYFVTRFIIIRVVARIFRKTTTKLDDVLIEKGLLNKFSYLVPIAIIYNFAQATGFDSVLFSRLIFS